MPALVNISVGSFRGTSGPDGTTVWPFRAKYDRNRERISLTLLIAIDPIGSRDRIQTSSLHPDAGIARYLDCAPRPAQ
jgi:hypothetical protein